MAKVKNEYNESSVQILEGLEAVRKRPGMYIGSTDQRGLHHLVWEIFDNSIDESLAGFCTEIKLTIEKNGSISVEDNGRGIPLGIHASGKPTPEVIFSTLHSGAKFNESSYKTSGGLHGVGSSVVNALSKHFKVTICRDGKKASMTYSNGGLISSPLKIIGKSQKTGTKINFIPDPKIFTTCDFSFAKINERLKESAFLNSGLKISISDLKKDIHETYIYPDGLKTFIESWNKNNKPITKPIILKGVDQDVKVDLAIQYVDDYKENLISFANNVKTPDGGTHVAGFHNGLVKTINDYCRKNELLKDKDKNFDLNEIKEGLSVILVLKVPGSIIQYEGQTKSKLGTPFAKTATERIVAQSLLFWFNENSNEAKVIFEKINLTRIARLEAKKAKEIARNSKKTREKSKILSGKLTLAQGKKKELNELFLVEGDSAGGSAKTGRDRNFQAILPLRGKVVNAMKTKFLDLLNNEEIRMIIQAIGSGVEKNFNIEDINYGKIIIMTDADTDGAHIQTLLITFFYRYMRELFENSKVFLAMPPLYKVSNKKSIKYAWDDQELRRITKKLKSNYSIQRYKGLGEMNADQLWETTMNPETRQLICIKIDDLSICDNSVQVLMGDDAQKRKKWIQENVNFNLEDNYLNLKNN